MSIAATMNLLLIVLILQILAIIDRLVHEPDDAREDLRQWLRLHAIRTFLTDIPAWLCFLGVVLNGIWTSMAFTVPSVVSRRGTGRSPDARVSLRINHKAQNSKHILIYSSPVDPPYHYTQLGNQPSLLS